MKRKIIALEILYIEINASSRARTVSLVKTEAMTHLLTYATAFLGRHFRVTQRESLEIQAYPVELKRRETTKSCRVFYLMELKPQEERQFLIFEYDDVT